MSFVNGVDVSAYQTNDVNWQAVKRAGYWFAIAKATEGTSYVDPTFARNLTKIRAAGLVAGAYHFFSWTSDPVQQAHSFLDAYKPIDGDLPPTLDVEACTVGSGDAIARISAFLYAVEPHLNGAKCLLYMSYSFPTDHLGGGSGFSGHPLWVAAYNDDPTPPVPDAWDSVTIWQHADDGKVAGIPGNVDLNRFVGTLDDLKAFTLRGVR